ncbi:MAG: response regulator transcription factor [Microcoleaceae cyanobacterium]
MARVLVIEDSMTEAEQIISCLQQAEYEVISVTTAEAAKAILEQKTFDAILTDVVLPGQSGFGFCRELRNHQKTAEIPIIICSSKSSNIDKKWGLRQGASAYVTKPINPEELVQTLKQFA